MPYSLSLDSVGLHQGAVGWCCESKPHGIVVRVSKDYRVLLRLSLITQLFNINGIEFIRKSLISVLEFDFSMEQWTRIKKLESVL